MTGSAARHVVQTFVQEPDGEAVANGRIEVDSAAEATKVALASSRWADGVAALTFTVEDETIRTAVVLATHGEVPAGFVDGLLDFNL